jgi:hypothetical protein
VIRGDLERDFCQYIYLNLADVVSCQRTDRQEKRGRGGSESNHHRLFGGLG